MCARQGSITNMREGGQGAKVAVRPNPVFKEKHTKGAGGMDTKNQPSIIHEA